MPAATCAEAQLLPQAADLAGRCGKSSSFPWQLYHRRRRLLQADSVSCVPLQVLTGDMLLAAAFVSYAGPFTSKFRAGLIKEWIKFLMDKGAPMTPGISDPLKVGFTSNSITAAGQASLPHALSVTTSPKSIMVMTMVMNAASVL